jgi:hypothetical protein
MNIAQASNLTGRGAQLLSAILSNAPLLQHAEFKADGSTHFVVPNKSSFTSTAARAVNGAPQKDNQAPAPTSRSLALYSREVAMDDVYKQDQQAGLMSPAGLKLFWDRQLKSLGVKLGLEVQDQMIAGSDATNEMLGFSYFVKDAASGGQTTKLGFTTTEQAAMNVNADLTLDNVDDQNSFVELLERELANVPGANCIIVNTYLKARLSNIARRLGALGQSMNSFGVPVQTFNSIPIVAVPTSAIANTESDGATSDCTSLYVVRFAEDLGVCFSTNSGFKFTEFENTEDYAQTKARLDFYLNLTVEQTDALRRISRIKLA